MDARPDSHIAHGPANLESDFPAAHSHRLVTQLIKLLDSRPDLVDFQRTFTPDAQLIDPIAGASNPISSMDAIRKVFELRAKVLKPTCSQSAGEGTAQPAALPSDSTRLFR